MKIFGCSISHTTVFFKIDDERYELIFDKDIFGNIKIVEVCRHNLEKTPAEFKVAEVISVTPKNVLGRIKMMWFIIRATIIEHLKKNSRGQ